MGTITIIGTENLDHKQDEKLLTASLAKAFEHTHKVGSEAKLFVVRRKPDGWLEYGISIKYSTEGSAAHVGTGGTLYIGCIQRKIDADCEFHS